MRIVQPSSFRKDIKKQKKRGKGLGKLKVVVDLLTAGEDLPDRFVDHALTGKWLGWREYFQRPVLS